MVTAVFPWSLMNNCTPPSPGLNPWVKIYLCAIGGWCGGDRVGPDEVKLLHHHRLHCSQPADHTWHITNPTWCFLWNLLQSFSHSFNPASAILSLTTGSWQCNCRIAQSHQFPWKHIAWHRWINDNLFSPQVASSQQSMERCFIGVLSNESHVNRLGANSAVESPPWLQSPLFVGPAGQLRFYSQKNICWAFDGNPGTTRW